MDWLGELAKEYDILLLAVLYVLYKEGWPWVRDKLFPAHMKASAEERRYNRRREDQAFGVIKENTVVLVGLQKTLEAINMTLGAGTSQISQQLATNTVMLTTLLENVAGIYGVLGAPRPNHVPLQERTTEETR